MRIYLRLQGNTAVYKTGREASHYSKPEGTLAYPKLVGIWRLSTECRTSSLQTSLEVTAVIHMAHRKIYIAANSVKWLTPFGSLGAVTGITKSSVTQHLFLSTSISFLLLLNQITTHRRVEKKKTHTSIPLLYWDLKDPNSVWLV